MKANVYQQMMSLPVKCPLRGLQAEPYTLQHPLLRPLHSQLHTKQHHLLQPLHPWLRAQTLLACLDQSMEWNHLLLSHLWQVQSAKQWPLARPTLVSTNRPLVMNLVPFIRPLPVSAPFQCLGIPCLIIALLP